MSAGAQGGVWVGEAVPVPLPGQGRAGLAGIRGSRDSRVQSAGHPHRRLRGLACSPCLAKAVEGRVPGLRRLGPAAQEAGAMATEEPLVFTEHLPCGAALGWWGGGRDVLLPATSSSVPSPVPGSRAHPTCFAEFPQESRQQQVSGGGRAAGSRR